MKDTLEILIRSIIEELLNFRNGYRSADGYTLYQSSYDELERFCKGDKVEWIDEFINNFRNGYKSADGHTLYQSSYDKLERCYRGDKVDWIDEFINYFL